MSLYFTPTVSMKFKQIAEMKMDKVKKGREGGRVTSWLWGKDSQQEVTRAKS